MISLYILWQLISSQRKTRKIINEYRIQQAQRLENIKILRQEQAQAHRKMIEEQHRAQQAQLKMQQELRRFEMAQKKNR